MALIGIGFTEKIIWFFRDDPEVIAIGAIALAAQFVGQLFQPLSVCTNMLFQSVGKVGVATLMSMLRSGLFFLPVLLVTSSVFGLKGIQFSQAIADILTMFVAIPFVFRFLRTMGEEKFAVSEED